MQIQPTPPVAPELALSAMRELMLGKSIEQLEVEMMQHEQEAVSVVHRFGPGIYMRELTVPAGMFIIGHEHKDPHMNVMLKGRITLVREDGSQIELSAPAIFVGEPGRKVCYVHEEMVWQNIYATTETDVEKLEEQLFCKSEGWQTAAMSKRVASLQLEVDRKDYLDAMSELGLSDEQACVISGSESDQMPMPHGGYKVVVSDSQIHGKGLFATADISSGELIAPAKVSGKSTPAGSKTNHAAAPNAAMVVRPNGDIDLVALRVISGSKGGMPGEEITIDYRQALGLSGIGV
jgi:hypothetical protein